MKISNVFLPLQLRYGWNMRFSPDGDGPPGGGSGDDKTFTQQQLEQIVQGRIAKLKEENELLKKNQTTLDARLKELEDKKNDPPPHTPPPTVVSEDDVKGQLKLMEARHKAERDATNAKLEAEVKKREAADKRRKEVERDSQISSGLQTAGCRSDALEMGKSFFISQVELDEEEDKWHFRLKDGGGRVSIAEGIKAELPDYLKEPSISSGGSGSRSGAKNEGKQNRLTAAKEKLAKLAESAKSARETDILAYQHQKRTVQALEKELVA